MNVCIHKLICMRWRAMLVMDFVAFTLALGQGNSLAAAKKSLVDINTATHAEQC